MIIDVRHGLPFIEVTICFRGEELHLKNVLLDTGSAGTIFSAMQLMSLELKLSLEIF
jgi:hypothetical protein